MMLEKKQKPSFIWQFISYAYAALLIAVSLVQLMGIGSFNFSGVEFTTPGSPYVTIFGVVLQVLALITLLGVRTGRILRKTSEACLLLAPLFLLGNEIYLISTGMTPFYGLVVTAYAALIVLGIVCLVGDRNWETR